jgi:hypothetical protein
VSTRPLILTPDLGNGFDGQGILTLPRCADQESAGKAVGVQAGNAAIMKSVEPGKVIRDSFTMPVADHELIGVLKKRCIGLGIAIKKSELLRAGLASLQRLPDASLAQVVAAVESVKTGRPPGKKKKKKGKTNRAKDKR